ncbi:hypothetical protein [Micrococcus luteus]|uniref:hypothetical protein n=1 Tax=Micrococcus luteus TaxID=1270 RepID=UPI0015F1455F|nr:hypothetical protein [Micrococcus luteus]
MLDEIYQLGLPVLVDDISFRARLLAHHRPQVVFHQPMELTPLAQMGAGRRR